MLRGQVIVCVCVCVCVCACVCVCVWNLALRFHIIFITRVKRVQALKIQTLLNCVALGKPLNLSVPQLPHLQNENNMLTLEGAMRIQINRREELSTATSPPSPPSPL